MNEPTTPTDDRSLVQWRAVVVGALVGLGLLLISSVIATLLDHYLDDFDNSGWRYPVLVGVLVSFAVAGWVAGRAAPDDALTNGTFAGLGSFVLWIPARILIWVVRDEDKGLFTGHAPALRPGQVLGYLVIAAALGMLGGWLGAQAVARANR